MSVVLSPGLLEALEQRWRTAGALYIDEMAPGLTDEQIDTIVAPIGFTLPEEARRWYRWHDGSSRHYVTPSRTMSSLAEDVRRTLLLQEQDPGWKLGWLATMDEMPLVAFDCRDPSNDGAPVWHYDPVDQPTRPIFHTIGDMVTLWIELIDEGYWAWSAEHGWRPCRPLPTNMSWLVTGIPSD
jgi:hypothetical protein